jgi:hypothetical protein
MAAMHPIMRPFKWAIQVGLAKADLHPEFDKERRNGSNGLSIDS